MEFYNILSKKYEYIFPKNKKEEEMLAQLIPYNLSFAIDVGCGIGFSVSHLSNHAEKVIGLDSNQEMIEKAKTKYSNHLFLATDMRKIDELQLQDVDVVTCFGNTLVHINHQDVQAFLSSVYDMLKKGGQFLIQIINYDRIYNEKVTELPIIDNQEITMKRNYTLYDEHLIFSSKLTDKQSQETFTSRITLYPLFYQQLLSYLTQANFEVVESFGGFDMSLYSKDSYATIVHAIKKD